MVWATVNVALLTFVLRMLKCVDNSLLVGYPLLIAASGLWFQVRLVWFMTALTVVAYYLLQRFTPLTAAEESLRQYPNIFLAALVVTGFVVARQVKRI